jgi:hypothetical protein
MMVWVDGELVAAGAILALPAGPLELPDLPSLIPPTDRWASALRGRRT